MRYLTYRPPLDEGSFQGVAMKLVRATKDLKVRADTIKKGCIGIVNGHATFHTALTISSIFGAVYEISELPSDGLEGAEIPGDDGLAQKAADHLRWSMDPADPFTNTVSAMLKEVLRGKPNGDQQLSDRLAEMV